MFLCSDDIIPGNGKLWAEQTGTVTGSIPVQYSLKNDMSNHFECF